MTRTTFTADPSEPHDVWVGPGLEPRTRRRLSSRRWQNHFVTWGEVNPEFRWLAWLTSSPEGLLLHAQIQTELVGLRLGCSNRAHGLIFARLADGVPVREIQAELRELLCVTRPLFRGAS